MRQTLAVVFCATCFALFRGCSNKDSAPTNADTGPSESNAATTTLPPSEVLTKFYRSLADSNNSDAISCTTGDSLSREFVDSQVRLNRAFELLGTNSVECFGEDGKKLQAPPPALKAMEKVEQMAVVVSGSTRP